MRTSDKIKIKPNPGRIFVFCLIILQSLGPRFFSGQGILLSLIIISLSYKSLNSLNKRDYSFLLGSFVFLLISKLINPSFTLTSFIYQLSLIISAYLFILQYRKRPFMLQIEFFITLKLFVYHAIIGYLIYLVLKQYFFNAPNTINDTLYYIFYVSSSTSGGIHRNTGLFWEPGVFQLAANLYLFYCIKNKQNIIQIIIAGITVVSSFSTTGLIILVLNFIYFFYLKYKSKEIAPIHLSLTLIAFILFIPVLNKNAGEKMDGENTSGLVRMRDFLVCIELIKEKPILGHGFIDSKYLLSKQNIIGIEEDLLSDVYLEETGNMAEGITNGLLSLVAWYGIPISLFIYYLYFKNKFIPKDKIERSLFCAIPLLSMISEPIAYTSFFLMFAFSSWILNNNQKIYIKKLHS